MTYANVSPYSGLEGFLPSGTLPLVRRWLVPYACSVGLSRPRRSKLGDFRRPRRGQSAQITVNRDLPPLQFLLTLTHEIAHLHAFGAHRRRIRPHGKEWKNCFAVLLRELASVESLPRDYRNALLEHAVKPRATAQQDLKLWSVLKEIEAPEGTLLYAIAEGALFEFRGRRYLKLRTARTRCVCRDRKTGRDYYISKAATVSPV